MGDKRDQHPRPLEPHTIHLYPELESSLQVALLRLFLVFPRHIRPVLMISIQTNL